MMTVFRFFLKAKPKNQFNIKPKKNGKLPYWIISFCILGGNSNMNVLSPPSTPASGAFPGVQRSPGTNE